MKEEDEKIEEIDTNGTIVKSRLKIRLKFLLDKSIEPHAFVCEFSKMNGAYLSFIDFYVYMSEYFKSLKNCVEGKSITKTSWY